MSEDLDKPIIDSMIQPKEEQVPKEEPMPSSLIQSTLSLDETEQGKIKYLEKLNDEKYKESNLKENMVCLMDMGFYQDFDRNLDLLEKNQNNIDIVLSKMFE
jgi:hypothetical protein